MKFTRFSMTPTENYNFIRFKRSVVEDLFIKSKHTRDKHKSFTIEFKQKLKSNHLSD